MTVARADNKVAEESTIVPARRPASVPVVALIAAGSASAEPSHHRYGVSQTNLVSDQPGRAQITDPNLKNAWGMSRGANSPIWVSNADTGTSTLYSGAVNGSPVVAAPAGSPLIVKVPGGPVTGQTSNSATSGFVVPGTNESAAFMFATVGGNIAAWNGAAGTQAATVATVPGAVYTGLTEAQSRFGPLLLAADFHDNRIDVFTSSFQKLDATGLFRDRFLPRSYAPFNAQVLGDHVYVTYAKQDADKQEDVDGKGLGFVDRFSTSGILEQRVASHGALNARGDW